MMNKDGNGERRFLWQALNVLCVVLLTATLSLTGWTLTQVIGVKVNVASIATRQRSQARRLGRIERHIDATREANPKRDE